MHQQIKHDSISGFYSSMENAWNQLQSSEWTSLPCRSLAQLQAPQFWSSCREFKAPPIFKLFKLRAAVIRQFQIIETAQVCEVWIMLSPW